MYWMQQACGRQVKLAGLSVDAYLGAHCRPGSVSRAAGPSPTLTEAQFKGGGLVLATALPLAAYVIGSRTSQDSAMQRCQHEGPPDAALSHEPGHAHNTAEGTHIVQPVTRYARSGDVRIAFQVVGSGPLDLVFVPGFISNLDISWESPVIAHFFSRLSSFSRLILFDKRGTGLSDRVSDMPTLEQRMDDVRAVLDATGSERAALFGISEGGAMSVLFAATYPERTQSLILYGAYSHFPTWVLANEKLEEFLSVIEQS